MMLRWPSETLKPMLCIVYFVSVNLAQMHYKRVCVCVRAVWMERLITIAQVQMDICWFCVSVDCRMAYYAGVSVVHKCEPYWLHSASSVHIQLNYDEGECGNEDATCDWVRDFIHCALCGGMRFMWHELEHWGNGHGAWIIVNSIIVSLDMGIACFLYDKIHHERLSRCELWASILYSSENRNEFARKSCNFANDLNWDET